MRNEIIKNGINLNKSSFGICKNMEWKLYSYKGERYNVSMFNDDVDVISKIYCNTCDKATYNIKVLYGSYICNKCYKECK